MNVIELQNGFGIDSLNVVQRPEPRPGPGEALIRWRAFSLNYRDLLLVRGQYNPRLRFPFVPLSDGAGEVVEVGPGVTRLKAGDRVAGCFMQAWIEGGLNDAKARSALGGGISGILAEYGTLSAEGLVHFPAHLSFEEAATLPCAGVTAWHALVRAGHVKAGDSVLTQGTGGVSLFALQFARVLGARVLITSSSDAKLERTRQLGAHETVNYRTTPEWDRWARERTGGAGVDHLVELGGAGTLPRSFQAVRTGGQISLIGVLTGNAGEVNPLPVLMKNLRVQGIYVGSREMFEAMNRAIALHQLRPVIDRVFPMTDVRAALRHQESGAHFGKICLSAG